MEATAQRLTQTLKDQPDNLEALQRLGPVLTQLGRRAEAQAVYRHVIELAPDRLLARRDELVELLKGDFFFGTRDLPMTAGSMRALFHDGLLGWIDEVGKRPLGVLAGSDFDQLTRELDRVHLGGALAGHAMWAPEDLVPEDGGQVRDGGMATIGGGNHFVEIQVVEAVEDGAMAHAWGVRAGQLAVMIHSGSRGVGKHVGAAWRDKARAAWPKGQRHPEEGLFALSLADHPELVAGYLQAEATAANYGFVNRLLLAELIRLRMRQVFGAGLAAPLVYDLPHNITLPMDGPGRRWIRSGCVGLRVRMATSASRMLRSTSPSLITSEITMSG